MADVFQTKIEFLKGVGPLKAALLGKELGVFSFGDMLQVFPFRYEDKSKIFKINELRTDTPNVKIRGKITHATLSGPPKKQRLNARFKDDTGEIELVWFKGVSFIQKTITVGAEYYIFGKATLFNGRFNMAHPELESFTETKSQNYLTPVYPSTERLKARFLDNRALVKIMQGVLRATVGSIKETLPEYLLKNYGFISKKEALISIHFPTDATLLNKARARLKFEELFWIQLKLLSERAIQREASAGHVFKSLTKVTQFYHQVLPFELTNAQKRVIKEIRSDVARGKQMNRLLQGDVGSGKTIVAFLCMLMAVDNAGQACIIAPTEILAEQHYVGLLAFCEQLGLRIELLTGSAKTQKRRDIDEGLRSGSIDILVGTHAILEDKVVFKDLKLAVIDEQHRFGVAQRAKLWAKNSVIHPHILVMTATPIPRTLAMTVYGDLDVSVIDELPAGRKPIHTVHKFETGRLRVNGMIAEQIQKGRQVYIVFPLIEESETLELKNLMDGYHDTVAAFPDYQVSIVHGRLTPAEKDSEMKRFIEHKTHIMVATTVIEVGVNVPNATVMVIENAERFGLAQLHQLRGRVGRGAEQSHCILVTGVKLSKEAKTRMETMVRTTNGFEIADVDLQLRGPGDMSGTQQSGVLDMKLANLAMDGAILSEARRVAERIMEKDPELEDPSNQVLKRELARGKSKRFDWGLIS